MHVLALDTTTRGGSVALVIDDRVVEERSGDPSRTHAERLPVEVLAVAAARGIALADIDLFAVAAGPGSFTGLRIGIATMQGLAFATGRPLVAVSALDALGAIAGADVADGSVVAAWMDAHRGDVFAALYRVMNASPYAPERLAVIEGPTVGAPESTLRRWSDSGIGGPIAFLGDGALRYAGAIEHAGLSEGPVLAVPLLAGVIGRLAAEMARRGEAIDPGGVRPLYVRRPDAEVERERRTLHDKGHNGSRGDRATHEP